MRARAGDAVTKPNLATRQGTVMVKYVRREIRSLTDQDRERFLSAVHSVRLVRVLGGVGQRLHASRSRIVDVVA